MADISRELAKFRSAAIGENVRGSMISALVKMNEEASHAEEWATGGNTEDPGGGDVPGTENNAKYYAELGDARARAWADGTMPDGTPIPDTDPAYGKTARGYAEAAAQSASELELDATLESATKAAQAKAVGDALAGKVDAVSGKGLSENDYTDADKAALDNIKTTDPELETAGKAADAKATGDAIGALKESIEPLYRIYSETSLWKRGTIFTSSGAEGNSTTRIITKSYINNRICILNVNTGYRALIFGWDNDDVYQGCWTGSEFSKNISTLFVPGQIDIGTIKQYKLRLALQKYPSDTTVESDAVNMVFWQNVDDTLSLRGVSADAKATGDGIAEIKTIADNVVAGQENLDKAVFVYDFAEKTLASIATKLEGFNAGPNGNAIGFSANAGYDSYYFYADKDTKLYLNPGSITYVAITIGVNPQTPDIVWSSETAGIVNCTSVSRVRKSENNLPTHDDPLIISKGTVIAITFSSGYVTPIYIYEKTDVAKVDTISQSGVVCTVSNDSVTIAGHGYTVVFTKVTTTQGYQWNITSLSGADGQNMFPAGVDIIGVIQFVGSSNFMGGGHGNESNYAFRIMANGDDVSGTITTNEIHVIMESHLYDPDNTSSNVVDRFVEFVFTEKGWTCRNTFKVLINAQIQVAYPSGLFAFTASDCDGAYSNVGALNLASTTARQLDSVDFKEITINLPNKFTLNIHSETADKGFVAYRSNTTSFKVYFANAELETVTAGAFISGKCEYKF